MKKREKHKNIGRTTHHVNTNYKCTKNCEIHDVTYIDDNRPVVSINSTKLNF